MPSKTYSWFRREILPRLKKTDAKITNWLSHDALKKYHILNFLQKNSSFFDYSCNGIIWICGCFFMIWGFWVESWFQMLVNLILGLFFDVFVVAIMKVCARRARPDAHTQNTSPKFGPDKYSFPSGHASRSFFVAYFFTVLFPLSGFCLMFVYTWALMVTVSRVVARKHFVFDAFSGMILGLLEGVVVGWFYLSEKSAFGLVGFLTDERIGDE